MVTSCGRATTIGRRSMLGLTLATIGAGAQAQTSESTYPDRTVRLIIPAAPAGPTDVIARFVATGLTAAFGQPVVVVNRPGSGGNIGVVQAARAAPDGYTLLISSTGFVVNPSLFREPGYDPFRDFLPIAELGASPNVILATPASGITSVAQLIERAKAEKGKLNVTNPGQGSTPHLTAELLRLRTGIAFEHIPHNGAGLAIQSLLANTTPVGLTALPPAHAQIRAGALKALAITAEERWFDLPDVPTMLELGYPGFVSETFQGMFAPAGTPASIIQRVARDTIAVLKDPPTTEKLRGAGFDVRARGPEGLAERVAREVPMWRDLIVRAGIELQ